MSWNAKLPIRQERYALTCRLYCCHTSGGCLVVGPSVRTRITHTPTGFLLLSRKRSIFSNRSNLSAVPRSVPTKNRRTLFFRQTGGKSEKVLTCFAETRTLVLCSSPLYPLTKRKQGNRADVAAKVASRHSSSSPHVEIFVQIDTRISLWGGRTLRTSSTSRLPQAREVSSHLILHIGVFAQPGRSATLSLSLSLSPTCKKRHLTLLEPSGLDQRESQKLVAHDWPRPTVPNQNPAAEPECCALPQHNNRGLGREYGGVMTSPRRGRDASHG